MEFEGKKFKFYGRIFYTHTVPELYFKLVWRTASNRFRHFLNWLGIYQEFRKKLVKL